MTQSAQSLRQMRSIPHCSKAVFYVFVFYSIDDSATKHNLSPQIFHWTMFTHWWGEIGRLFLELNCGGQKQKTRERDCFRVLRCVQDSNQRPPAWQAGILTNWTNAPFWFCKWLISFASAKLLLFFIPPKFLRKKLIKNVLFAQKRAEIGSESLSSH